MVIKDFTIRQPQFWAVIVESSNNITLQGFLVNATNTDSAANGANWVQNTDGCDTYRSDDIKILDWVYDGGDDCIAFVCTIFLSKYAPTTNAKEHFCVHLIERKLYQRCCA